MITKNEFYGAYILQAKEDDIKSLSVNDLFLEINRAWSVVESLQEKDLFKHSGINLSNLSEILRPKKKDNQILKPGTYDGEGYLLDPFTGHRVKDLTNNIIDTETGEVLDNGPYSDKMPDGSDR